MDKNYLSRIDDIEWFPDSMKALHLLQKLGFELFIVTNQSGVGRGYFALEAVYVIHKQLQNDLRENKLAPFRDFAICPHAPDDGCDCRKPKGSMISGLLEKHGLKPEHCYMVGDKPIDAEAGEDAGVQGVIVRTQAHKEFPYFNNLLEFARSLEQ